MVHVRRKGHEYQFYVKMSLSGAHINTLFGRTKRQLQNSDFQLLT